MGGCGLEAALCCAQAGGRRGAADRRAARCFLPRCRIAAQVGAAAVPGHSEYVGFLGDFRDVWVQANGESLRCIGTGSQDGRMPPGVGAAAVEAGGAGGGTARRDAPLSCQPVCAAACRRVEHQEDAPRAALPLLVQGGWLCWVAGRMAATRAALLGWPAGGRWRRTLFCRLGLHATYQPPPPDTHTTHHTTAVGQPALLVERRLCGPAARAAAGPRRSGEQRRRCRRPCTSTRARVPASANCS